MVIRKSAPLTEYNRALDSFDYLEFRVKFEGHWPSFLERTRHVRHGNYVIDTVGWYFSTVMQVSLEVHNFNGTLFVVLFQ